MLWLPFDTADDIVYDSGIPKEEAMKKCTKCGEVKELGEYHKRKESSDGRKSACADCMTRLNRLWHKKNPEKHNERTRRYRHNNRERVGVIDRRTKLKNRDTVKAVQNAYRSRKRGAAGECSSEKWKSRLDYYGGRCVYCGSSESIEIEHRIPLSRGGTNWPSNLVPACKSCNCKKAKKTEFEFKNLLSQEQSV